MRCPNCGWMNENNTLSCVKCNYRLDGSIGADNARPSAPSGQNFSDSDGLKSTIAGSQLIHESWDAPSIPPGGEGRPTSDQIEGQDTGARETSFGRTTPQPPERGDDSDWGVPEEAQDRSSTSSGDSWTPSPEVNDVPPQAGEIGGTPVAKSRKPNFKGTIDPTRQRVFHQSFSLKPVAKEGESEKGEIPFTGEQVSLNRGNLDPDNYSITSREQAMVENVNGNWMIVDRSDHKTTSVQVSRPYALQNGDILIIGDRKFIFLTDD